KGGIRHPGFALINVFSPCVTYNVINTYDWFRENLVNLDELSPAERHDPHDRDAAIRLLREKDGWVRGLVYQDPSSMPFEDRIVGFGSEPIATSDLTLDESLW